MLLYNCTVYLLFYTKSGHTNVFLISSDILPDAPTYTRVMDHLKYPRREPGRLINAFVVLRGRLPMYHFRIVFCVLSAYLQLHTYKCSTNNLRLAHLPRINLNSIQQEPRMLISESCGRPGCRFTFRYDGTCGYYFAVTKVRYREESMRQPAPGCK